MSLSAPGSTIYAGYPSARIGAANFVGSGTSFSSAIVSGAAALVLAGSPGLTPDQLKARLLGTTSRGPVGNPFVDGHGALDAYAAATSGLWSGVTWNQAPSGDPAWNGWAWNDGDWNGWAWNGRAWNDGAWAGSAWAGAAWTGGAWSAWN